LHHQNNKIGVISATGQLPSSLGPIQGILARMTGVQVIVPLDDDPASSGSMKVANKSLSAAAGAVSDSKVEEEGRKELCSENSSAVLSDELREQFETMKAVWRQARRPSADDLGEDADKSEAQDAVEDEEVRRKQRKTAVETALAVDAEISRWKNGIAELEAMLAAEDANREDDSSSGGGELEPFWDQGQENVADYQEQFPRNQILQDAAHPHPPLLQFPHLPPVVLDDDDCDSVDD
jgi:hypothetical protein